MDAAHIPPVSRRSFSLPVARGTPAADPQIAVLYTLPYARIVSFSTSNTSRKSGSGFGSSEVEEEAGTLPCVSRFESTIAVGALRIYRAPESVAFLNCGAALKPILPKSQAWCVDGDSKFVIQIRRPQYWRIEVSNKTAEDKSKVDELKKVLSEVLLFEKTPCPFQRDFTIELPEPPKTPTVRKAWKPVQGPTLERLPTPEANTNNGIRYISDGRRASSTSPMRQSPLIPATRRNSEKTLEPSPLDISKVRARSPPEAYISQNVSEEANPGSTEASQELYTKAPIPKTSSFTEPWNTSVEIETEDAASNPIVSSIDAEPLLVSEVDVGTSDETLDAIYDTALAHRGRTSPLSSDSIYEPGVDVFEKPQVMQKSGRSITAPPVLSLVTSPPSKHRPRSQFKSSAVSEIESNYSSSAESFHSIQSWHSPLAPPSPPNSKPSSPIDTYPYPHNNITLSKQPLHSREVSEVTLTPNTTSRVWDLDSTPSSDRLRRGSTPDPKTPTLMNDTGEKSDDEAFEILTPPKIRSGIRHRATTGSNSRRRELSPLPAAVNLFSPTRRRPRRLQTTRHLPTAIIQKTCEILLSPPSHLLHLMLNIASKIAAGEWRGFLSGHGDAVHWDFEDEYSVDAWLEDDYGVNLPHAPGTTQKPTSNKGSWEVD